MTPQTQAPEPNGGPADTRTFEPVEAYWRWDGESLDHILIGAPRSRSLHLFNPVGATIYSLCDGRHTVDDMTRHLADRFRGTPDTVRRDVESFLHFLDQLGLIHERQA